MVTSKLSAGGFPSALGLPRFHILTAYGTRFMLSRELGSLNELAQRQKPGRRFARLLDYRFPAGTASAFASILTLGRGIRKPTVDGGC